MDQDPWSEAVAGSSSGLDPIVEASGYISNPPPKGNAKGKQFFFSKNFHIVLVEHTYVYIFHEYFSFPWDPS